VTNPVGQHLATIVADDLEDLLHFLDEARVVDRFCQLDVAKMALAFRHIIRARLALELSIDGAHERVVEAAIAWLRARLVHRLRVDNVCHAKVLDLLRRQDTELDLLHSLERRARLREIKVRHLDIRDRMGLLQKLDLRGG
jgi:hypothetical protein